MKPTLIGLVFLCGQPMFAQSPSQDAFVRDYLAHEESLYTKYCFNRKVVFTVTVYNLTGETTELRSKVTSTEVSSSDSLRTRGTVTIGAGSSTEPLGSLRTGSSTYLLGRGKSADVFGIKSHRAVHNPTEAHPGFGSSSPSCYPLTYEDAINGDLFGAILRRQPDAKDASKVPRLDAVQSTQLDGKPVIAAKFKSPFDINSTIYLDPANDYAYLGFDSDGSFDVKTKKKGAIKMTGRLTYRTSEEGFPLPVKSETWYILPSGKRLTQSLVEISSFEKYTPSADDFDLEKQFGVKPLPLPGTAAYLAANRSWRWLYFAAATGFAILSVLMILYIRRARNKRVATRS